MVKSKSIVSFVKAIKELEQISLALDDENTDIDKIEDMIIRTKELVKYCREKLRSTETNVNKIIEQM